MSAPPEAILTVPVLVIPPAAETVSTPEPPMLNDLEEFTISEDVLALPAKLTAWAMVTAEPEGGTYPLGHVKGLFQSPSAPVVKLLRGLAAVIKLALPAAKAKADTLMLCG